ncbi:hypothetical protein SK803_32250 [Lentzea sp. BCCO 10_0856]|uniref:Uncharacterized protein n=1 Tax=Lentzea miocenica TaxID=3095431 RepID=A0ABU4T9Q9_9PSEU|nr:hypothetical protein [Lentzea sp. BCCO 10_0856]MDX8034912.1 hypothetical protein [Lentzea sp. BCCO 10_0856]
MTRRTRILVGALAAHRPRRARPAVVHLATNSGGVLVAWYVLSSA